MGLSFAFSFNSNKTLKDFISIHCKVGTTFISLFQLQSKSNRENTYSQGKPSVNNYNLGMKKGINIHSSCTFLWPSIPTN